MKSIAFCVVDHDYIEPLRVALKTFRSKNPIPFKVFKIDDFKVPDDLKNLPNVEFIDFKPEKTLKFVKENYNLFNKESFNGNLYDDSKLANMFAHLEIEDLLMKDYDVVFKTDIDVCYFENIENSIKSFFESNLPIAMAREHIHEIITRPLYKFYKQRKKAFNCGFLMLNSKKCKGIFKAVQETMKKEGFEKCVYLDQDALNLAFEKFYDLTPHGFINANVPLNEKLPENISALHYNVTDKPFADISVKHCFDAIAVTTYSGYLNIAEMCKCSVEFLEKIKNQIEYVKKYSSLCKYNFYFQRGKFSFAMEIAKKMKKFKL
jgi:hypothetical protein